MGSFMAYLFLGCIVLSAFTVPWQLRHAVSFAITLLPFLRLPSLRHIHSLRAEVLNMLIGILCEAGASTSEMVAAGDVALGR